MKAGITYDLREDHLAWGFTEEEVGELTQQVPSRSSEIGAKAVLGSRCHSVRWRMA
jgi:hypothetical protein